MLNILNTIIYIMFIGNIYLFLGVVMSSIIKKYISKPYNKQKSTTDSKPSTTSDKITS